MTQSDPTDDLRRIFAARQVEDEAARMIEDLKEQLKTARDAYKDALANTEAVMRDVRENYPLFEHAGVG